MKNSQAYIVDAIRTPIGRGKEGCAFSEMHPVDLGGIQIGRASCRERVCQYV